MKYILICAFCLSSVALASEELKFKVPKDLVDKLKNVLDNQDVRGSGTTAIINEYADILLANLDKKITNSSLDPLGIPGFDEEFLGEEVKLDNGELRGLSSLHRYKDVVVNYQTTTKTLTVTVPIEFYEIEFTYDYLVRVLFIPYEGGVVGRLTDFKMNYVFGLDFNTYHISLKASDIIDSGHIDLTFNGNIIDIVFNLLSEVITTILHPLIVGVIQVSFNAIINGVVDAINDIIDSIFHNDPTSTTAASMFLN